MADFRLATCAPGWHSDDEAVYKRDSAIASVSLGATRDFVLRRKEDPGEKLSFRLNSGDLLVMQGAPRHGQYGQHQHPIHDRPGAIALGL